MSKLTDMFGLCKRAGKLVTGFDAVKDSIRKGKAWVVIIASDLSEKTIKELEYNLEDTDTPLYRAQETLDEINFALGRRTGVISIEDENLAKASVKHCQLVNKEEA